MSLSSNNYTIADARLARVYGQRLAGAYGIRLGIELSVMNWTKLPVPVMLFLPSLVTVTAPGSAGLILGRAMPEVPLTFNLGEHSAGLRTLAFDLALPPAAIEAVEEMRNGESLTFSVALQAEVRCAQETAIAHEHVSSSFTVSDWLDALAQCGYGHSLLFEVPMPEPMNGVEPWAKMLASARTQFLKGHYDKVVADCRLVLEALTRELDQAQQVLAAVAQHRLNKRSLSSDQRELIVRQAAIDYCSMAHHIDTGAPVELFDRRSAQMMLAMTATLVSAALRRNVAADHE